METSEEHLREHQKSERLPEADRSQPEDRRDERIPKAHHNEACDRCGNHYDQKDFGDLRSHPVGSHNFLLLQNSSLLIEVFIDRL